MEKIFEARTTREAIEQAVRFFGVNEEFIEIQILEEKKSGFWGFKKRVTIQAKVIGLPGVDLANQDEYLEEAFIADQHHANKIKEKTIPQYATIKRRSLGEKEKKEVAEILEQLITKMGMQAGIEFYTKDDQIFATLLIDNVEDQNLLIGKFGKNIDALQLIVNAILQGKYSEPLEKVVIEIEEYRDRRTKWLKNLAHKKAKIVLRSRKTLLLAEMTPYDRKIVHNVIRDIKGVATESQGNGYRKKMLIFSC